MCFEKSQRNCILVFFACITSYLGYKAFLFLQLVVLIYILYRWIVFILELKEKFYIGTKCLASSCGPGLVWSPGLVPVCVVYIGQFGSQFQLHTIFFFLSHIAYCFCISSVSICVLFNLEHLTVSPFLLVPLRLESGKCHLFLGRLYSWSFRHC